MFVSPKYAKKHHMESKSNFIVIGGPLNKAKITLVDPSESRELIDDIPDYKNTFGTTIDITNPQSNLWLSFDKGKEGCNGKRLTFLVVGPSGCGKSTWCINYMNVFRYQNKDPEKYPIYFVTGIPDDPRLSKIEGCHVIDVHSQEDLEYFFVDPTTKLTCDTDFFGVSNLNNSLIVFDDIEGVTKNLRVILDDLISNIMKFGRHNNCNLIWSRHTLNSNNRLIQESLAELMYIVLFKNDSYKRLTYFCDKYLAQGKELVKYIRKDSHSRFTLIHNRCPFFIMNESFLHVIDE
jgi:hypothetical protein